MKNLAGIFLLFLFLTSFSCSETQKRDASILPEKEMTDVMWDLMKADQFVQDYVVKDSTKNKTAELSRLYNAVFKLHHVTIEQFNKSKDYYQSDPVRFRSIIDSLARKQPAPVIRPSMPDTNFQHRTPKQIIKE